MYIDCSSFDLKHTDICLSRENNQRNTKSLMAKLFPARWQFHSAKHYGVQQYKWIWVHVIRPWMDNVIDLMKLD